MHVKRVYVLDMGLASQFLTFHVLLDDAVNQALFSQDPVPTSAKYTVH